MIDYEEMWIIRIAIIVKNVFLLFANFIKHIPRKYLFKNSTI